MLFDLTFPCYLTTFSGKKCLSGKVICAFFCPAYRSSTVQNKSSKRRIRLDPDYFRFEDYQLYITTLAAKMRVSSLLSQEHRDDVQGGKNSLAQGFSFLMSQTTVVRSI
jgi:hypothetical protein